MRYYYDDEIPPVQSDNSDGSSDNIKPAQESSLPFEHKRYSHSHPQNDEPFLEFPEEHSPVLYYVLAFLVIVTIGLIGFAIYYKNNISPMKLADSKQKDKAFSFDKPEVSEPSASESKPTKPTQTEPEKDVFITVDDVKIKLPYGWLKVEQKKEESKNDSTEDDDSNEDVDSKEGNDIKEDSDTDDIKEDDNIKERIIHLYKSGKDKDYSAGFGQIIINEVKNTQNSQLLDQSYNDFISGLTKDTTLSVADQRQATINETTARVFTLKSDFGKITLHGNAALFFTENHLVYVSFLHPEEPQAYKMESVLKQSLPFSEYGNELEYGNLYNNYGQPTPYNYDYDNTDQYVAQPVEPYYEPEVPVVPEEPNYYEEPTPGEVTNPEIGGESETTAPSGTDPGPTNEWGEPIETTDPFADPSASDVSGATESSAEETTGGGETIVINPAESESGSDPAPGTDPGTGDSPEESVSEPITGPEASESFSINPSDIPIPLDPNPDGEDFK